jgi:hypothetical protein
VAEQALLAQCNLRNQVPTAQSENLEQLEQL